MDKKTDIQTDRGAKLSLLAGVKKFTDAIIYTITVQMYIIDVQMYNFTIQIYAIVL